MVIQPARCAQNWAYGIARRACPQGAVGGKAPPPQPHTQGCPLLSAHDARIIAGGRRLRISTVACVMSFKSLQKNRAAR